MRWCLCARGIVGGQWRCSGGVGVSWQRGESAVPTSNGGLSFVSRRRELVEALGRDGDYTVFWGDVDRLTARYVWQSSGCLERAKIELVQ